MSGRPGLQGNQMPVGLAIHRWRGNPELDPVAHCFCKTATGSARLNPDIEQQIITLPLKKHVYSFLKYVDSYVSYNALGAKIINMLTA